VVQGTVLLGEQGKLYGFRLSDGQEMWTKDVAGVIRGIGNEPGYSVCRHAEGHDLCVSLSVSLTGATFRFLS
jgi:outer membrane protein assembly factor BamB